MCLSHVMNELLETERAYVEELLCVLEVSEVQSGLFMCIHHSSFCTYSLLIYSI